MFLIFFLIDGHFLFTLELTILDDKIRLCQPKPWANHFVGRIFVFIDALKYSAIPFCILLILSILIIQRVFHAQGISAQLQNLRPVNRYQHYSLHSNSSIALHTSNITAIQNSRLGRRVTLMLLSVSIAFCIFSAPMSLMQIVQSVSQPGDNEIALAIGKAIAELCQYINHSCSFFLYALTGRIFRREFVRLFFPTRFTTSNTGALVGLPVRLAHQSFIHHRQPSVFTNEKLHQNSFRTSQHSPKNPFHNAHNSMTKLATSNETKSIYFLWRNLLHQRHTRRRTDGSLLFDNILKANEIKPCSV